MEQRKISDGDMPLISLSVNILKVRLLSVMGQPLQPFKIILENSALLFGKAAKNSLFSSAAFTPFGAKSTFENISSLSADIGCNQLAKLFPVLVRSDSSYPRHPQQFVTVCGAFPAHILKGGVGKNNIGRHV